MSEWEIYISSGSVREMAPKNLPQQTPQSDPELNTEVQEVIINDLLKAT